MDRVSPNLRSSYRPLPGGRAMNHLREYVGFMAEDCSGCVAKCLTDTSNSGLKVLSFEVSEHLTDSARGFGNRGRMVHGHPIICCFAFAGTGRFRLSLTVARKFGLCLRPVWDAPCPVSTPSHMGLARRCLSLRILLQLLALVKTACQFL